MAALKFQPVIRRARVGTPGFSADAMLRFANVLNNSIGTRMDRALDVYDSSAPALSPRYKRSKERRLGVGIRDLRWTGRTRRGMRVLSAQQNKAVLGFSDPVAQDRMRINNRRSRQYGVSPINRQDLERVVLESLDRPLTIIEEKAG